MLARLKPQPGVCRHCNWPFMFFTGKVIIASLSSVELHTHFDSQIVSFLFLLQRASKCAKPDQALSLVNSQINTQFLLHFTGKKERGRVRAIKPVPGRTIWLFLRWSIVERPAIKLNINGNFLIFVLQALVCGSLGFQREHRQLSVSLGFFTQNLLLHRQDTRKKAKVN